jgi:hypothetical protein
MSVIPCLYLSMTLEKKKSYAIGEKYFVPAGAGKELAPA